jgi:redox-sensing transcriptional repressor
VDGVTVESVDDLEEAVKREDVEIAILTVPGEFAQDIADRLVAAGVRAIMNFAPVRLHVPEGVEVRQADLAGELQVLSFHLNPRRANA